MNRYVSIRTAGLVATVASSIMLSAPVLAHDKNKGAVQTHGRFTPNVEGAQFPPQPRRITEVRQYTPSKRTIALQNRLNRTLSRILSDASVQDALGARYAQISIAPYNPKGNGVANRYRMVFFSHSNNQTVTVITAGNSVRSLQIQSAAEKQPPLAQSELTEAIDLARQYWRGRGKSQVDSLTGYAIQTFQSDGSAYPTRMTYVSFHVASPEPPLLYNRVDLTTGQVVTGEEE